ncbi:probable WRKY transcription factor 35 [Oryza brachyantha]|nr:probable WRKY transcription factor 35 [Oryza brachyantha]
MYCDSLFWQSPADQAGDLSDVVRASLLQPGPAAADNSSYLQQQQLIAVSDHEQQQITVPAAACCDLLHALLPPTLLQQQPSPIQVQVQDQDVDVEDLFAAHHHHVPPIKRRKSQTKKVVCIPAASGRAGTSGEVVPSDLWAWRKYGQKPIKGSPYPRGYYRCSSSKGCSARKQVERSRADPSMLVVTYTSDHNHPWPTHRNALAGSTRPSSNNSSHRQSQYSHYDDHHRHHLIINTTTAPMITHLKQEDGEPDSDLFAGVTMDMMTISASSLLQPEQHQLGALDSNQQLLFHED